MQSRKAAIELPANFLVIIVLSLVILGFSVYFLSTIMSKAGQLSTETQEDLDKRIESLQCDGNVCMPVNYKKIARGDFEIFGLKIYNDFDAAKDFTVTITPKEEKTLDYLPRDPITFKLDANQERRIAIGIEVPKDAASRIYIFNVAVSNYENLPQQIRVEVP